MEKDLKQAILLLEKMYNRLHNGASYSAYNGIKMIEDVDSRNDVYYFVKKHKKSTKLKEIKRYITNFC